TGAMDAMASMVSSAVSDFPSANRGCPAIRNIGDAPACKWRSDAPFSTPKISSFCISIARSGMRNKERERFYPPEREVQQNVFRREMGINRSHSKKGRVRMHELLMYP